MSSITLKWGSLKGWHDLSDKHKNILKEYFNLGVSLSAMSQKDTPKQTKLICDLILENEGDIINDWSGEYMTKEQAIDYITNYGT